MRRDEVPGRVRAGRLALLTVLAAAGALVLAACGGSLSSAADSGGASTAVSLEVPDFTISAYQGTEQLGGTDVQLSAIVGQGKPVVLNFWAALCPPCRAEMPDFQRVHDERGDEVTIVGIDIGPFLNLGSRDAGRDLLAELDIKYPAGTTFDTDVVRDFRVVGMPTSVFLYPDGRLLRTWSGLLNEAKINEFIDQLVAG